MAVNKITNKGVVNKELVNRANEVSTKGTTIRGNRETTIIPGNNYSDNYSITLKDIDTSILSHIKNVMKPIVKDANETFKIPVYYGNEERWKAVRKRGILRDKNNALLLPLIILKRTSVEKSDAIPGYEHDIKRRHTEIVRSTGWSKDNRYTRFNVQIGNTPVFENLVTTMPNYVNITYEFILLTSYMEQMNFLIEEFDQQILIYLI